MDRPSPPDTNISRRRTLAAGAGLLASAGLAGVTASHETNSDESSSDETGSRETNSSGKCVFVYDDSPIEDYTKTYPVHRTKGAPGCFAVVPNYLGDSGQITVDQMLEMADAGFEIVSHTMSHQPIGWVPITDDVPEGETDVPVTFSVYGRWDGAPAWLLDDTGTSFFETIAGRGDGYVRLENGTDAALDASASPRFGFAPDYVNATLADSRDYLEDLGLTVNSVVAPFQIYDDYAANQASNVYAACANGRIGDGINHEIDPYWLDRAPMTGVSLSTIRSRAREVAANDSLYLLGSHSWDEDLTSDRIAAIIDIVREEGLEITTLNTALADAGIVSGGDSSGSSGGNTDSQTRHELVVEGTGPTVQFHAEVTDEIWGATGTLEDTDDVGGTTLDGQISTESDTYYFSGDLESFSVTQGSPGDIEVSVDGEPLQLGDVHTMTVTGSGPVTEFSFSVSDQIVGVRDTWEDTDSVGTSTVDAQVSTIEDTYTYYGSLESFDVTSGDPDDITVRVDGEELQLGSVTNTHDLVVRGSGPVTQFSFSVTGEVVGARDTWEDTDSVGTSTVDAQVSTIGDTYTFTGELEEFTVTEGSADDITVLVDGTALSMNGTDEHTMRVTGTGPVTEFTFSVSGQITGDRSTLEDTDSLGANTVDAQVSTIGDTYTYTGELEQFTVTDGSADDIIVVVDGVEQSVNEADQHTMRVIGTGPVTQFSFSVTGELTGDYSTLEDTDSVGASTVDAQVSTIEDTYTFTGELEQFTVTDGSADDITVLVDGTERSVNEADQHTMRVTGTGPVTKFSFAVTGQMTGDYSTLEDTDSVKTSTVDAQVSTIGDTYTFTGDLEWFDVTNGSAADIVVVVDGQDLSV